MTIIQVYATTSSAKKEDIDQFYRPAEDNGKYGEAARMLVDLNAKVGTDAGAWNGVIDQHGIGEENERGERLLNFCSSNNLVITNTLFKQTNCNENGLGHHRTVIPGI